MKIYDIETTEALTQEAFFARVRAIAHKPLSEAYISEVAVYLKQLANNRDLLWDHLGAPTFDNWESSFVGPMSFHLGQSERVALRMNVWVPSKKKGGFASWEDELYAYGLAHNHDFTLLTVGYHGPGYETDLYDFDDERAELPAGEPVALKNHRRLTLAEGAVWQYEQYRDVHVQREPAALSMSLNVFFQGEARPRDQLWFDIENACVAKPVPFAAVGRLVSMIEMVRFVANDDTIAVLKSTEQSDPFQRVRKAAGKVLNELHAGGV